MFILILLNLLVILIVETYKPILKILIRINILELEMFLNGDNGVNLIPAKKAVAL